MYVLNCFSIHLLLLFSSLSEVVDSSDEDFAHDDAWCRFSSRDLHDMEYILEHHFNKIMVAQYNSTTERWTGYTAWGVISAEKWNEDPDEIPRRRSDMDVLCKPYANRIYNTTEMFMVEPNVTLRLEGPSSDSSLVCSVHFFYPKHIRVTWLRNGEEVTSDVTSTDVLANGLWSYQIQSYLKYTPTTGERITCMVEHISQTEPKLYYWDPSLSKSEKNKIVIGVCGLLLGVVFVVAGLIYWKKSTGRLLGLIGELDYGTCD
ncbi:HLA class II histocompatibility antigen, DQ beta 1 chain-like isoform X1 [Oncorhynchus tshawytscha]|uniref:Ig-like domain-containing protein n=2 Tax=Oncorhynchus tshawytscha TaxID=74940 RepID=A0A8C8EU80_ONCTS|nr:HLA class II histocompatibility antigen, DQ beta 1 chain-like isoform X1 [Oncorhynchus tshawytscha]